MKRTVIALLTISICFCGDNLPAQLEQIKEALQKKYQVYSLEDLHKLKNPSQPSHRTASRDMEDLVGDWMMEEENMEFFVTVGTDQSIPNPFSMMGLEEAEGSVTATTSDFETDLNYLMIGIFGDDDDIDCDMNCEGEYDDYMDEGIDVSDEYCECCHEDYPIDEICEDDSSRSRTCLDLELMDSECDGWNGAYWYVTNAEGDTIDSDMGALGDGCDEQTEICLDEGDYIFYCVGSNDTTDDEISYVLYDGEGNTLCEGGADSECNFYVEDDDDGDDWSPEAVITNMNLMEFFMTMFGADPDSLGLENPIIVGISSTLTESGDIVFDNVFAYLFSNGEMTEAIADSAEAVAATGLDTVNQTITFTNLSLYDSTETAILTLSGTIGPSMMDFVAGAETPFPFLEGLEDLFGDDDYNLFMSFYEDSTGMEIEVEYEDDEYYYGAYADTSYFTWYATSDSLVLYEEHDDYYGDEVDTTELAYFIDGDTLTMEASFDPCEDEDSFEECIESASEEIAGLDELEDIESLRLNMGRVLTPGSFTAVDPGDGSLPQEFSLYANYPNPFNPVTTIRFDVGMNSGNNTILRVYDITGRNVATLINGQLQTGTYEVQWDARGFPSGLYFSELISGTKRQTQKMILLK